MSRKKENKKNTWARFVAWVNGEEDEIPLPKISWDLSGAKRQIRAIQKKFDTPTHRIQGYHFLCVLVCFIFIGIMLMTVGMLPHFGGAQNPASNEVVQRYLEKGMEETGAVNIVTGMILDYRAFDTFGESAVLFLAVICVIILVKRDENNIDEREDREMAEDEEFFQSNDNVVIQVVTVLLFPLILLYGIYVVLNGHLSPGGGFSGGAIIGSGLILYATAFGYDKMHTFFTYKTFTVLSVGSLLTYCAAKTYSFFTGANHLPSIIPKGIAGHILSGGLILPLNICVGIVVACTMYGFFVLFAKGEM